MSSIYKGAPDSSLVVEINTNLYRAYTIFEVTQVHVMDMICETVITTSVYFVYKGAHLKRFCLCIFMFSNVCYF